MMLSSSTSESSTQILRSFAKTVARAMVDKSRMFLGMRTMETMNVSTQSTLSSLGRLSTTKVSSAFRQVETMLINSVRNSSEVLLHQLTF
jgi:hypothetical protein